MLTQRGGGWPLTMFLTPDGTPFFAAPISRSTPRYGMPGFHGAAAENRRSLPRASATRSRKQNDALVDGAETHRCPRRRRQTRSSAARSMPPCASSRRFSTTCTAGIGAAPKFPHPVELAFCLRRHALDGGELARAIARLTLTKMAEGGIYDQLGGGFCRYSVDQLLDDPALREDALRQRAAARALQRRVARDQRAAVRKGRARNGGSG